MRPAALPLVLLSLLALARASCAEPGDADGFHPPHGAAGDLVYVQGSDLGTRPTVSFSGRPATILRATKEALLCRVPESLPEGEALVTVGGQRLAERFLVLAAGCPIIHGMSATVATPGQTILIDGRRLGGGHADFVDAHGEVAGSADVIGGRRVATFGVPRDLAPGRYRLRLTNERGLDSPLAASEIHVCAPGPRLVFTVRGGTVRPGQRVTYQGMNLGPLGSCEVQFVRPDESLVAAPAWSNGYDAITVVVPYTLGVDDWHQVKIAPSGEGARAVSRVFALSATAVSRLTLDAKTVASGGTLGIQGMPASGLGGWPRVVLTRSGVSVEARTLYLHPGGLGHGRAWVVRLPDGLDAGDYAVSVDVGGRVVPAGGVRVQAR